jgi:hypothetical protein
MLSFENCLAEPLDDYGLSDSSLETELDRFRNQAGFVSLDQVRAYLNLGEISEFEPLMDAYSDWVLSDLGIVIKKKTTSWNQIPDWTGEIHSAIVSESYKYMKARKRGNDMDAFRIGRKMRDIRDAILPYCESENHLRETQALYVTLTVDPRMTDGDLAPAWRHVGRWFNDFKSRIAKTFGTTLAEDKNGEFVARFYPCRIRTVRSWEAHESGQPHVHAILCFEDFKFGIFQDAKFRWRAKQKDRFQDAWPYGFVDVVALTPGTVERELENVLWYVSKSLSSMDYRLVRGWPRKRLLTQSILWYLGARSFSISKSLTERPARDLIMPTSIIQNRLDGRGFETEVISWEFVGLIPRSATELARDDWEKEYSEPPDWAKRFLEPQSSQRKRYGRAHPAWGA